MTETPEVYPDPDAPTTPEPEAPVVQEQPQDASGVADSVVVNQPNPGISQGANGEVIPDEGVNLADPRFWGEVNERPDPFLSENVTQEGAGGVPADTISAEGVGGPDSRWWTKVVDEDGIERYPDRDDMNYLAPLPPVTDLRETGEASE